MKFVRIFGDEDCLLTAHYNHEDHETHDEFFTIFDQWTDIEYLTDFFTENEEDLKRAHWNGITIDQAVLKTREEAIELRRYLKKLSKTEKTQRISKFSSLFKPLERLSYDNFFADKKKAYGIPSPSWLRLYALQVGDDMYIITGGAIKLTDNMMERAHTLRELQKIDICIRFLKDNTLIDDEGIIDYLEIEGYGN